VGGDEQQADQKNKAISLKFHHDSLCFMV